MKILINVLLIQLTWFACVLGAANSLPWLGVGVALIVSAWHLLNASRPEAEAKLLVAAFVIGLILDSALASSGVISFRTGVLVAGLTTPWMLGLWLSFATGLNISLRALMSSPALAILFGAIGGPLAYWSGAKLGAISLGPTQRSLIAIGIGWAAAMACFVLLTRRLSSAKREEVPT